MTEQTQEQTQTEIQTQTSDESTQTKSLFSEYVGDGKKYKSPDDLVKGKLHADEHINTLTQELKELREQMTSYQNAKDVLEEIKALKNTPPTTGSDVDIDTKISQQLRLFTKQQQAEQNEIQVTQELVKTYGSFEKAAEALNRKAVELGVDPTLLKNMVADSPKAALKLLLPETRPTAPSTSPAGNTTVGQPHTTNVERDNRYWTEQRRKLGNAFWNPENLAMLAEDYKAGKYKTS